MKRFLQILVLIVCSVSVAFAQTDRKQVRQGNRDFRKGNYQEAEIFYKKGLLVDSLSTAANYNLGNTLFRMENYQEADKYYNKVADSLGKMKQGADVYHNMGNSLLAQKNYQGAIDAYKDALRRNPSDMETKSNLAYAQKMLENQQQNQNNDQNQKNDQNNNQNQDQNQNQNQDQNQDQDKNDDQNNDQNQDKNDQNQDQNDDQNDNDQNNDKNQSGQGQTPPPKISQQDAQQMLQAIQDKENDTQEKVKKEKALMMRSKQKEKNW